MYLAGSKVCVGDNILFQYVHGNDRPVIDEICGRIVEVRETVSRMKLLHMDVCMLNNKKVNGITHKFFWVHLIIDGSVWRTK